MSSDTPWVKALTLPKSDDALTALIRVAPVQRLDIHLMDKDKAVLEVDAALSLIYHPSAQDLRHVREMVSLAASYARQAYATKEQFIEKARGAPGARSSDPEVRFFTGPAGVGKSSVIAAAARAVCTREPIEVCSSLPAFPFSPLIRFEVAKNAVELWNSMLSAAGHPRSANPNPHRTRFGDLDYVDLKLYQLGVCLLAPDELQNITLTDSNAQVTGILLKMREHGRPVMFVGNYDLGHKLLKRPPQDTARLLSRPMIMLPDSAQDPAFLGYLDDIAVVFGIVRIDFEEHAGEIHRLTFGLRRFVRRLFVIGYGIMRAQHKRSHDSMRLKIEHLRAAYASREFEADRKAVEQSHDDLLNIGDLNPFFRCPFQLPKEQQVLQREQADARRDAALRDAQDAASRTREEREAQAAQLRVRDAAAKQSNPAPAPAAKKAVPKTATSWLQQVADKKGGKAG